MKKFTKPYIAYCLKHIMGYDYKTISNIIDYNVDSIRSTVSRFNIRLKDDELLQKEVMEFRNYILDGTINLDDYKIKYNKITSARVNDILISEDEINKWCKENNCMRVMLGLSKIVISGLYDAPVMKSLDIPEWVSRLGDSAFYNGNFTRLPEIIIHRNLEYGRMSIHPNTKIIYK